MVEEITNVNLCSIIVTLNVVIVLNAFWLMKQFTAYTTRIKCMCMFHGRGDNLCKGLLYLHTTELVIVIYIQFVGYLNQSANIYTLLSELCLLYREEY